MVRRLLHRLLLSSTIDRAPDVTAAWGSIMAAYLRNLVVLVLCVAAIFVTLGLYHPLVAPFDGTKLRLVLVISNIITFVLTFLASRQWQPSPQAKEAQKAANRSKGEYLVLLFLFWCASLILLLGNLTMPTFGVLLANVAVHSALFQLMISQRTLVSQN
jgi:hypothetical protein